MLITFKRILHDFKYNTRKSSFAMHLLDNHSLGPIGEVMDILHTTRKGKVIGD
jgi:hypothetical protein